MSSISIHLGDTISEFLLLKVLRRQRPHSEDYWDANWLDVRVEVSAGSFTGVVESDVRTDDFVRFRQEITELYTKLKGTALFSTIEGWLEIKLIGDGIGHIVADCMVMDYPGIGNTLTFTLELDQTYLPGVIKSIDLILQAFPVIGKLNP